MFDAPHGLPADAQGIGGIGAAEAKGSAGAFKDVAVHADSVARQILVDKAICQPIIVTYPAHDRVGEGETR